MWYVYMVACSNGALYTGVTTDPQRRLREHQHAGSRYTSYNPALGLAYTESCPSRSAALKREAQIKRRTRRQKLALIRGDFPGSNNRRRAGL